MHLVRLERTLYGFSNRSLYRLGYRCKLADPGNFEIPTCRLRAGRSASELRVRERERVDPLADGLKVRSLSIRV